MLNRKGQNIAEYSILIALVIAAAIGMQMYVKRGLQGRVADAVDHAPAAAVAGQNLLFNTKQYEPYYADSDADITTRRNYDENLNVRGDVQRQNIDEAQTRAAGSTDSSNWGGFRRNQYDAGR